MTNHFLQYWLPSVARATWGKTKLLTHSGSEQFKRVNKDDVVWIVTTNEKKRLILIGRIIVDHISDYESAKKEWGDNVWDSNYHIFSADKNVSKIFKKDITKYANQLKFISKANTTLSIKNNKIDGKQLQTLRLLDFSSANILNNILFNEDLDSVEEIQSNLKSGAGFGNPIENRKVEKAAIKFVTNDYMKNGWSVRSVEADKVGYDLECKKENIIEKVEVKGIRGSELSFIITANEVKLSETDNYFILCVVRNALSKNKILSRYTGIEFKDNFITKPIAYKAVVKT